MVHEARCAASAGGDVYRFVEEAVVEFAFSSDFVASFPSPTTAEHAVFSTSSAGAFAKACHSVDLHAASLASLNLEFNMKIAELGLPPIDPLLTPFAIFLRCVAKVEIPRYANLEHCIVGTPKFK
jgi:hypothetical protein